MPDGSLSGKWIDFVTVSTAQAIYAQIPASVDTVRLELSSQQVKLIYGLNASNPSDDDRQDFRDAASELDGLLHETIPITVHWEAPGESSRDSDDCVRWIFCAHGSRKRNLDSELIIEPPKGFETELPTDPQGNTDFYVAARVINATLGRIPTSVLSCGVWTSTTNAVRLIFEVAQPLGSRGGIEGDLDAIRRDLIADLGEAFAVHLTLEEGRGRYRTFNTRSLWLYSRHYSTIDSDNPILLPLHDLSPRGKRITKHNMVHAQQDWHRLRDPNGTGNDGGADHTGE